MTKPEAPRTSRRPGAGAPATDSPGPPPAGFAFACARRGVPPEHVGALFRIVRNFRRAGQPDSEAVSEALDDYDHWKLYLKSREGDRRAAETFEGHWRRYITLTAGRRSLAEVDEIASIFFERVYRLVGAEYRWKTPFTVYLRTVFLNVCRRQGNVAQRRRRRETSLDPSNPATAELPDPSAPSPEEALMSGERQAAVRRAVEALAPIDRHLVRACLLEGRSADEMVERTGFTRANVYQRLHRARKTLRKLLKEEGIL